MQRLKRTDLSETRMEALLQTEAVLPRAWCPHSGFRVAAGLLLEDKSVIFGVNLESDSYGLTLCAERSAITAAQSMGRTGDIEELFLTAGWADPEQVEPLPELIPCGACRQWLAELATRLDRDIPIYSFSARSAEGWLSSARKLLPGAFRFQSDSTAT